MLLFNSETVRRVETAHGSHIEPPLEQWWPALVKLQWHAAVLRADTGLEIEVVPAKYWIGKVLQWGHFTIMFRNGSTGPLTFDGAWTYINGIDRGYHLTASILGEES